VPLKVTLGPKSLSFFASDLPGGEQSQPLCAPAAMVFCLTAGPDLTEDYGLKFLKP
jgi:hypothetical protein